MEIADNTAVRISRELDTVETKLLGVYKWADKQDANSSDSNLTEPVRVAITSLFLLHGDVIANHFDRSSEVFVKGVEDPERDVIVPHDRASALMYVDEVVNTLRKVEGDVIGIFPEGDGDSEIPSEVIQAAQRDIALSRLSTTLNYCTSIRNGLAQLEAGFNFKAMNRVLGIDAEAPVDPATNRSPSSYI